jgi:hypothetical protein
MLPRQKDYQWPGTVQEPAPFQLTCKKKGEQQILPPLSLHYCPEDLLFVFSFFFPN